MIRSENVGFHDLGDDEFLPGSRCGLYDEEVSNYVRKPAGGLRFQD